MTQLVRMRIVGSILVVVCYFIILNVDTSIGSIGTFIGDMISLPFFLKTKAWDVVVMLVFLMGVSITGF